MQQLSNTDNSHDADTLHAQTGAQVSTAQPSGVAQLPSMLVSLQQPAQVPDERGNGVPHVQSAVNVPVAAQEMPTVSRVLNTCTTFIMGRQCPKPSAGRGLANARRLHSVKPT